MNRAERIYKLHALLKRGRPVSLQRMRDTLEASRATVVRDLGYLRDFMDAPIVYDREANGHKYDPDAGEFELPGLWFNETELYALLASEQLLETVQPGLLGPAIGPLRARIRKLLEEGGHTSETVTSRVILQPVATRRMDDELFGRVSSAVFNGKVLDLDYHGRERDSRTRRRVHAHRLLRYRDNWYLIAWCERANNLRTFSLDRIRNAAETESSVEPIPEAELNRYLGASFGIFTGEATEWAVLRFSAERARWVADEIWHPDQIGQWQGAEYELQVPYSDPRELLMDVLKYGPDVEVIAPPALRALVGKRLQQAAAHYLGTQNP